WAGWSLTSRTRAAPSFTFSARMFFTTRRVRTHPTRLETRVSIKKRALYT
ncbi:MAG: hypothetical protein AVDCRST_MAG86-2859, partial [uncultured Truepera sp.]